MSRKCVLWIVLLLTAAIVAAAKPAENLKDLNEVTKQAARLDNEASKGHEAIFESLSKQLNLPVATLQAEQKSTNFGFGQLFIANSLAAASGKTFDAVSQEFKSGKGWGVIAQESNVKLGKVVSDLKRANKQVEKERMERTRARGSSAAPANSRQGNPHGPRGSAGSGKRGRP